MNVHEFDEVQLLRSIRSSDSDPTEAETARGLAALERGIETRNGGIPNSRRKTRSWRPRRVIWGAVAVVTVGAMTGIVFAIAPSSIMGTVMREDPEAQAAALLERSAELLPDLQVEEGQYLRVETRLQQPMSKPVLESGKPVTYMTRENSVHYIPYDLAEAWTFRTEEEIPTEILDPSGDADATQDMIDLITPHLTLGITEEQYLAGQFPLTPEGETQAEIAVSEMESDRVRLMNAPTDPAALRSFLLEEFRLEQAPGIVISEDEEGLVFTDDGAYYAISEDDAVSGEIFDIVSNQMMPRELRAACLRLLTKMPKVTAEMYIPSSQNDIAKSLSGRAATVITTGEREGESFQLIFDEGSASLIGARIVLTERNDNYPGLEPGAVVLLESLDTRVVDAVPVTETW